MDLQFYQVSNEMANTIAQSLDLDEYEAEYGEIVKTTLIGLTKWLRFT